MKHLHLAGRAAARADANGRNADLVGDECSYRGGDHLKDKRETPGFCQSARVIEKAARLLSRAALNPVAAKL
eukprot:scaffold279654_cov27-Tisochrysis_lutea.AAC.2